MAKDDSRVWYAAFKAKDARFDGRFFVGVSSTGIYCRPVCRAKLPKIENCTFFASAAEAEQAGFRPCLLCRPELAPGAAPIDAVATLAHRVARFLEENCGSVESIEELASRLGCTDRHLRRAFAAEYHVSPIQYLQTCRLLLAKSLLTDTSLSIIDVAMAAGFGSLRRFNDLFKKQYRLAPTALRREVSGTKERDNNISLALGYRPPYQWQQILDFLALRAIPGVETISGGEYCRSVHFVTGKQRYLFGGVRVGHRPQKNVLTVTVDAALLPVLPQVLARVRHLFDLHCDPDAVYETLASMNDIHPGLCVPGTRLPGCFDAFEMSVRVVLGQQITVKAASTLAGRFVEAFGVPIQTKIERLTHSFPLPETIIALDGPIENHLGPLGITAARARTILKLAEIFVNGTIDFDFCVQPEAEMKKLLELPGIGDWTAQYIAMRAMGWPDAFPHTDYGVKKALAPRTPKEILALAESWRPWRSYATITLWNSL
ncbi:MAG: helix-turn-helix domain-containing protein [Firmicutes bacterium]|nr:helix-turn-helix domain-containing protein [Bacillota bacterium]